MCPEKTAKVNAQKHAKLNAKKTAHVNAPKHAKLSAQIKPAKVNA
jgi:hypothetical protein